jgi:hypothetical protein
MSVETRLRILASLYETHARELAECLTEALAGVPDVARCERILRIRETFRASSP